MCKSQAEGGQRCAFHARQALDAAREKLASARALEAVLARTAWRSTAESRQSGRATEAAMKADANYEESLAQFASTPEGAREVTEMADDTARSDRERNAARYALRQGEAVRAANARRAERFGGGRRPESVPATARSKVIEDGDGVLVWTDERPDSTEHRRNIDVYAMDGTRMGSIESERGSKNLAAGEKTFRVDGKERTFWAASHADSRQRTYDHQRPSQADAIRDLILAQPSAPAPAPAASGNALYGVSKVRADALQPGMSTFDGNVSRRIEKVERGDGPGLTRVHFAATAPTSRSWHPNSEIDLPGGGSVKADSLTTGQRITDEDGRGREVTSVNTAGARGSVEVTLSGLPASSAQWVDASTIAVR